jgi:hypothetical protein
MGESWQLAMRSSSLRCSRHRWGSAGQVGVVVAAAVRLKDAPSSRPEQRHLSPSGLVVFLRIEFLVTNTTLRNLDSHAKTLAQVRTLQKDFETSGPYTTRPPAFSSRSRQGSPDWGVSLGLLSDLHVVSFCDATPCYAVNVRIHIRSLWQSLYNTTKGKHEGKGSRVERFVHDWRGKSSRRL